MTIKNTHYLHITKTQVEEVYTPVSKETLNWFRTIIIN